ncbi:spindle checkpoint protein MAD2 NDAI_0C02330 [Naumovozyma dairenensis CBS 421]|uniref:HORMA domain-containing protein n=1 Tax=Naumovozyma dairenensis (strain ATCC 10597 / BCRC 20456 / CBS 421 / NBRC 0211 / NRRL Y-12639) TaxID=1071378 RepID=G0W7Y2_NAUDC|nr:hypothetical protein NDAI_0C02330 [Naumovozyma dairenensis CBS 421]CCD23893.1 hypothetical protein NDAI_0C02330 [Naumovozyma dairenensis CBS 421]
MSKAIPLKGSTRVITEFFEYSINSILYQRGVYPADDFSPAKKYGLTLLKTHDDELKSYIRKILLQVHKWLLGGKCNKLVLCIVDKDEGEVVERWAFEISHLSQTDDSEDIKDEANTKTETQNQIRGLIRQITASVTFLPELTKEGSYTFNVLAYTDAYAKVPLEWADSESKEIVDGEIVQLKEFLTEDHKVSAQVSYKT